MVSAKFFSQQQQSNCRMITVLLKKASSIISDNSLLKGTKNSKYFFCKEFFFELFKIHLIHMRYSVYKVSFLKIQDPDETMKIVNNFFSNTSQKIYTIYNISDSLDTEKQGTNTFFFRETNTYEQQSSRQ